MPPAYSAKKVGGRARLRRWRGATSPSSCRRCRSRVARRAAGVRRRHRHVSPHLLGRLLRAVVRARAGRARRNGRVSRGAAADAERRVRRSSDAVTLAGAVRSTVGAVRAAHPARAAARRTCRRARDRRRARPCVSRAARSSAGSDRRTLRSEARGRRRRPDRQPGAPGSLAARLGRLLDRDGRCWPRRARGSGSLHPAVVLI